MTSMTSPPPSSRKARKSKNIPSGLLRDLRDAAAFMALTQLYEMDAMSKTSQEREMAKRYWGDEDSGILSTMNKVVNGSEAFRNLYEELTAENGMDLIIKDHVHGSGEYFVAGRHFDSSILSLVHFTKPDNGNISGTGLLEAGKKVLKNCKKAISRMRKLNGKIVKMNDRQEFTEHFSGEKEVDLMRHTKDDMYMMLNNEKK